MLIVNKSESNGWKEAMVENEEKKIETWISEKSKESIVIILDQERLWKLEKWILGWKHWKVGKFQKVAEIGKIKDRLFSSINWFLMKTKTYLWHSESENWIVRGWVISWS